MYDFWLGTREQIEADELRYLIAVKRMMPRWINSIPDSEFIALAKAIDDVGATVGSGKLVIVETGAGASTLACAFYALKYDGIALSWDMNGAKGSAIRTVCNETMGNHFHKPVDDHWRLIAYHSLSLHLGLPILDQLVDHVDVFFHDSEHTWETLEGELRTIAPMLSDGGVVALDDANQDYVHTNVGYINTFRRKLGLDPIAPIAGNTTERFYVAAERLLREHFHEVEHLPDEYKERYADDPYFAYFDAEFDIKAGLKTERTEALEHRFDSWRVGGRRG